ncbi:uncharacterized protein CCOS01_10701 [Colletotrichum costaricense]|uniref:Uncharacterized protein n=2 Tax=Colletotrichum acutatum species complex TaxID=2707335 RepID=A0AAI9YRR0_9PEZI|nr:uncharacterized protein CCOS01_10701 [Colletotrichum costaricense]XP_060380778.1 uncharacterized protein CTAM01_08539 [Colletotrichum tamarilloi]KAK1495410.1 hypothetical protein CTAM01_08539 [Colletotrichum tamarilloi]KAK1520582.1 hypothetical protein CCOS01_10701 [Colletotrichum costaricense]
MPPKVQKPQNWTFTLIHATISERRHREKDWLCTSSVENAVLNLKQEILLADAMGSRGNANREPNHVLIVPRQGAQALKLGLGSRDGAIPRDADYMLGYCPGANILVIRESLRSVDQQIRLRFKSQSDKDQVLGLFQSLGFQARPMQSSRRQPTPLQQFRSSSVAGDFQTSAATQPYSSRHNASAMRQEYQGRLGSPPGAQFSSEGSHSIPRASSVAVQTYRPSTSVSQRAGSVHQSSNGFEKPYTFSRSRTAFTEMPNEYASQTAPPNTEYRFAVSTPSTIFQRRPSVRPPPASQDFHHWNLSPSTDEVTFAKYDERTTRPRSSTQIQDMLPPRRQLPFSVGSRADKEAPEMSITQMGTTHSGTPEPNQDSQGVIKEGKILRPHTSEIEPAKVQGSAERGNGAQTTRINFVKRKEAGMIDNPSYKKQKCSSQTTLISTSPIPLPAISSAHFQRRALSRAPGLATRHEQQPSSEAIENGGINQEVKDAVDSASVNKAQSAETDVVRHAQGTIGRGSSSVDAPPTMSVVGVDQAPPIRAMVPVQYTDRVDASLDSPRPVLTNMDHSTQTEPTPSGSSEKTEELFIARFKLMWDIRNLHQTSFHRLLDTSKPNDRIDENRILEDLEQGAIDLCQVAIDRYGPEVGDIPYEKLLKAIMGPRY